MIETDIGKPYFFKFYIIQALLMGGSFINIFLFQSGLKFEIIHFQCSFFGGINDFLCLHFVCRIFCTELSICKLHVDRLSKTNPGSIEGRGTVYLYILKNSIKTVKF